MFVIVYHSFGGLVSYATVYVWFLDASVSVRPDSHRP
jgi:hypothetical protein